MHKHIYLGILVLIGFSCSEEVTLKDNKILTIDLKNGQEGKLSALFNTIEYTLLDAGDNEVLAMPANLIVEDSLIFVRDSRLSNIMIYNKDGSLYSVIRAHLNPGPGEFLQSEDFQIGANWIKIRDYPQNKSFTYNFEGTLLDESRDEDELYYYFHETDRWKLAYMGFSNGPNSQLFLRKDKLSEELHFQYSFPNEYDHINVGSKNGFMKDFLQSSVYFVIPYSYEIVRFDENGFLDKVIELDIKNGSMTKQERSLWSKERSLRQMAKDRNLITNTDTFFPMRNHFFIHLRQATPTRAINHFIVYNKDFELLYHGYDLDNDIDGMQLDGVPWSYSENSIILIINSNQFYNAYIKCFGGKSVKRVKGNVHDFFQKNLERLKEDQYVMVNLNMK
ncbi:6-bladed beta-propeller [Belliella aquatica]|uniref:6-bladed beta-propeller protein n=1 Tax=Belliella aquatica TaxID=1323734 RepID=A0ABQ1MN51_9BACT|nr:6-bladed beta-propeller [Belliella aquatica]MCH7405411.1 6-bladed beta-propeller [Belliella aquatica]GGC41886.1 hypothetical protein GCM10010993_20550 [Belliella aquatica]